MPLPAIAIVAAAGAGFISQGGLGGIVGGGARRREQGEATAQQAGAETALAQGVFGAQNPYNSLRLPTEAAEFQRQGNERALSNTLGAFSQRGNFRSGQALFGQALRANQQIGASLASAEVRREGLKAQGEQYLQDLRLNYQTFALGRADRRKAASDKARQDATQALFKGIGGGVAAGLGAASAGPGASFSDSLRSAGFGAPQQSKFNSLTGEALYDPYTGQKYGG